MTITDTYVRTHLGLVDLIAVERFIQGKPVVLEPAERPVAIWAAAARGLSRSEIAARLRCRDKIVKDTLEGPPPTDSRRRPLFDPSVATVAA